MMVPVAKLSVMPDARSGVGFGVSPSAAQGDGTIFAIVAPTLERPAGVDEAAFHGILAVTYDLVLSVDDWRSVLAPLCRVLGCHYAAAVETTRSREAPRSLGVVGITAADHCEFLKTWHNRNVYGSRCPPRDVGAVMVGRMMVPTTELVRSDMYRDYLAPREIQELVRLDVFHDGERSRSITLARPWQAGPFTHAELGFVHALMPHLARSAVAQMRVADATADARLALEALDAMAAPVVLLDCRGQVVHASADGERTLREADGLSLSAAGLRGPTPAHSARLAALIACASGTKDQPGLSGTLRLPRPSGKPDITILALPVGRNAARAGSRRARVMLQVIDPLSDSAPDCALVTQAFGLTRAEARLASDLLRGLSVAEAAATSGRSIATMRTHLANVLAKTETTRQTELIRLLMRLPQKALP
jgi:DNA-binding CsgD family transcriptional regulator